MNNEVDYEILLGRALADVRHRARFPVVFGGSTDSARRFTISRVTGGLTGSLQGLVIQAGQGIGGIALASGRAAVVSNYLDSARITHHYDSAVASEGLRSIVAAPVVVGHEVRAVLYGASRDDSPLDRQAVAVFRDCATALSFELSVAVETAKRMRALETAAALRGGEAQFGGSQLREAHAELLDLARATEDPALRERLTAIAWRMSPQPAALDQPGGQARLSTREVEVLALVALGCTNVEVADRLRIERETAKSYLRNCMRKLEVHSRTAAVTRARSLGLLP